MSQKRDYYEILDIPRNSGEQEIKKAYRKLALQYHPDRNPGEKSRAEERFKEITEAYSVLADQEKRSVYDRFGHAGLGGASADSPDFSSTIFADFEDLFGDFLGFGNVFGSGGSRRQGRTHRGMDRQYDLEIAFKEAATGIATKFKYPRYETCPTCHGQGSPHGRTSCGICGGRGQIRHQQGFFTIMRTCPQCQGSGEEIRDPCRECTGQGRVQKEKTLNIQIPAGVEDGNRLRLSSEGDAGVLGGHPGDLYVVLQVKGHPIFERENQDLRCSVSISVTQAALGTEITIPTLKREEKLRIPAGTQSGSVFRLRGKGFPRLDGRGTGNLYVTVNVLTPTRLTKQQRELIEQLDGVLVHDNEAKPRKDFEPVVQDT